MVGIVDQYSDTLVFIGVIEAASNHCSVGIIWRLLFAVVYHKSRFIAVEGASDKGVVAAVIDASVKILVTHYVGHLVIFAKIHEIQSRAAIYNMTFGDGQAGAKMISRASARDTAADEGGYEASGHGGVEGLTLSPILSRCRSDIDYTMPCANLIG